MINSQTIKELAKGQKEEIIQVRRHLHMYPELSFKEWKTSDFIAGELEKYGIPTQRGIAETGIMGIIEGRNPRRKVIALRAEMDALPVKEVNPVLYKSKNEGIMHACGHDLHMSSLLGTAKILMELNDEFEGTVLLLFQPGEELIPGGAQRMLDEGVFHERMPEAIIAQHVTPELETGQIGFRKGIYMASNDELHITIKGKGGHAAFPNETIDSVLIASKIIVALKELINGEKKISSPTILSFGKLIAPGATNVVPEEVNIEGTFRTFDEGWRKKAHRIMKKTATEIAVRAGGSCDFRILTGYPVLINDAELTEEARESTAGYLGNKNIVDLDLRMSSEDFALFEEYLDEDDIYRLAARDEGPAPEGIEEED